MRRTQFKSLAIDSFETDTYPLPLHGHTYYEMVYIFKGSGTHHINQAVLDYKEGDLFLISPGDFHYFVVKEKTDFMFIKFTDRFFEFNPLFSYPFSISTPSAALMNNAQFKEMKLKFASPYKSILRKIATSIREYDAIQEVANSALVFSLVYSIFELIRETTFNKQLNVAEINSKENDLVSYIHQHIYQPEHLKIKEIAGVFGLSPNYFSTYFKRNFTMTYQDYVALYKLQLIERRLISNTSSLKNIAAEFGFTDLSHLNAFFKRYHKVNPSVYRTQKVHKKQR